MLLSGGTGLLEETSKLSHLIFRFIRLHSDMALLDDEEAYAKVFEFRQDEKKFLSAFSVSYSKLLEVGLSLKGDTLPEF